MIASSAVLVAFARVLLLESQFLMTAAVLALATTSAMHARLAMGRWRAGAQLVATAALLASTGAPPRTVGVVFMAGVAAAELIGRSSQRAAIFRAAALTALVGGLASASGIVAPASVPAVGIASEALAAIVGCLAAAPLLVTAGPIAEWLFGHRTALTMREWLSYEHPLLMSLASRAPGTFQHSINVGVLADAAARAIGADALLARLGGMYHDVGKTEAPDYFIENQQGTNPHDRLAPWESARILRAHVTDGVALIAAHRLGERIADVVREHHGTGTMRAFRHKSESWPAAAPIEESYRYAGPRPQSRETAIVMIADQLEATARVSAPADDAAARTLVRDTLARTDEEHQLDDAGLTAGDRTAIVPALARALLAMSHRRLPYPALDESRPRRVPFLSRAARSNRR